MCNCSVHSLHFNDYELPDSTLILINFNYSLLKLKESPNSILNAHSFATTWKGQHYSEQEAEQSRRIQLDFIQDRLKVNFSEQICCVAHGLSYSHERSDGDCRICEASWIC